MLGPQSQQYQQQIIIITTTTCKLYTHTQEEIFNTLQTKIIRNRERERKNEPHSLHIYCSNFFFTKSLLSKAFPLSYMYTFALALRKGKTCRGFYSNSSREFLRTDLLQVAVWLKLWLSFQSLQYTSQNN